MIILRSWQQPNRTKLRKIAEVLLQENPEAYYFHSENIRFFKFHGEEMEISFMTAAHILLLWV